MIVAGLPHSRKVVLCGSCSKLAQSRKQGRMRWLGEEITSDKTCIDRKVTAAKHQAMDTLYCCNLVNILHTLDRLDLRDNADMLV